MQRQVIEKCLGILLGAFIGITSFFFFTLACLVWVFTLPFDKRLSFLHLFTSFWSSLYLWVFPLWSLKIEGRTLINKNQTYIFVSNHQSLVDIIAAFRLFTHFKWVSKGELFNIPLLGWNMYLNHYIRLKRGKKSNARRLYRACERHLKNGSSVFIFPEGSRSTQSEPRSFREGAFVLSKRLNIPIIPIAIKGSHQALTSSFFPSRADMKLTVLPAVHPDPSISAQEMATKVRLDIIKALDT